MKEYIKKGRESVMQALLYNNICKYSGYIVYIMAKDKDSCCCRPSKGKW